LGDDRAAWRAVKRRAADRIDQSVERELHAAATRAWGRGLFRPPWRIVKDPDEASWRAYRYVDSAGPDRHRYVELGVVCHLDPDGDLVGFGVDNGIDFLGLHDTSEYGLRRGLEYILKQPVRIREYAMPVYEHRIRGARGEG
jgi:hypothetical protein